MSLGLGSLARMCLLIALIGGTIHPPGASAEATGAGHDRLAAVHALSPDDCCVDAVGGAAAHDGSCMHVCPGGAALLPGPIELAPPRPLTMGPAPEMDVGARLPRPDPEPPKPVTDAL